MVYSEKCSLFFLKKNKDQILKIYLKFNLTIQIV